MVINHIFARLIHVSGAAQSHRVKLDTPTMLHNTFTSTWLSAAYKGLQDVFTSKWTWLLARAFLQACWVSWLSGSTDHGLTHSTHFHHLSNVVSSSTAAGTTLAPGGFTQMNETLCL